MDIGIFYFSATGVTETFSNHIAKVLKKNGNSVELRNIITQESRQLPIDFSNHDACIFGFPVFAGRPPTVAEEWMSGLNGKNLKCSMFFTYGARDLEWAHQVTYYLLSHAHFQVVLSAEFIGRHSFNVAKGWSLAKDRPNKQDLITAGEFALQSDSRFQKDSEFTIDLTDFVYKPVQTKKKSGGRIKLYPSRTKDECSMCFLCENECPVNAFNAKTGKTNRKLCIICMHCVTICPDKVIHVGDLSQMFKDFTKFHGLKDAIVDKKRSRVIY